MDNIFSGKLKIKNSFKIRNTLNISKTKSLYSTLYSKITCTKLVLSVINFILKKLPETTWNKTHKIQFQRSKLLHKEKLKEPVPILLKSDYGASTCVEFSNSCCLPITKIEFQL